MAAIFKGVSEALGREMRVPEDLALAMEHQETLATLQVRVVERSANSRFTEGSVHGGSRSPRASPVAGRAAAGASAALTPSASAPRLAEAEAGGAAAK